MKKRLLPLTAASLLALVHPALSQETAASPTATQLPSPTATPLPASTPATASATATPAEADSGSKASTASADEIKAAGKADPAAVAESPAVPGNQPPSPVTGTTSESEATGNIAEPSPGPSAAPVTTSDADILPEPTDASLGAPIEPPPEPPLPSSDANASDLPNPDSLIPSGASDADIAPPAAPTITENKFDKTRKLQVRYQEVKLQALKDPAIRSMTDQAEKAKTDELKRAALREYYRLLFAKMTTIDTDADFKTKCDTMEQAYLRRLGQYRVSPSIPLQPPPTPEPLVN